MSLNKNIGTIKDRIIRLPEVEFRTGKSRSSIYADMAKGTFPKSCRIAKRAIGWSEVAIDAWIASRPPKKLLS